MTSNYLFVYGSLLKQANNVMSTYLGEKSTFLGDGFMKGKLYMIDYYPGAIYLEDSDHLVKGDVYELTGGDSIFQVLDDYEDFIPSNPGGSLFIRKLIPVKYQDQTLISWVYIFNRDVTPYEWIASGDYIQYDMKQH